MKRFETLPTNFDLLTHVGLQVLTLQSLGDEQVLLLRNYGPGGAEVGRTMLPTGEKDNDAKDSDSSSPPATDSDGVDNVEGVESTVQIAIPDEAPDFIESVPPQRQINVVFEDISAWVPKLMVGNPNPLMRSVTITRKVLSSASGSSKGQNPASSTSAMRQVKTQPANAITVRVWQCLVTSYAKGAEPTCSAKACRAQACCAKQFVLTSSVISPHIAACVFGRLPRCQGMWKVSWVMTDAWPLLKHNAWQACTKSPYTSYTTRKFCGWGFVRGETDGHDGEWPP